MHEGLLAAWPLLTHVGLARAGAEGEVDRLQLRFLSAHTGTKLVVSLPWQGLVCVPGADLGLQVQLLAGAPAALHKVQAALAAILPGPQALHHVCSVTSECLLAAAAGGPPLPLPVPGSPERLFVTKSPLQQLYNNPLFQNQNL